MMVFREMRAEKMSTEMIIIDHVKIGIIEMKRSETENQAKTKIVGTEIEMGIGAGIGTGTEAVKGADMMITNAAVVKTDERGRGQEMVGRGIDIALHAPENVQNGMNATLIPGAKSQKAMATDKQVEILVDPHPCHYLDANMIDLETQSFLEDLPETVDKIGALTMRYIVDAMNRTIGIDVDCLPEMGREEEMDAMGTGEAHLLLALGTDLFFFRMERTLSNCGGGKIMIENATGGANVHNKLRMHNSN